MNKFTRLTALLLALMMIFSTFASAETAYQVGDMTTEQWEQIVTDAEDELSTIEPGGALIPQPTPEPPVQGDFYPYTDGTTLTVGDTAVSGTITSSGVAVLTNASAGQWQMLIGDTWVNISGETGESLWVTAAMMNGLTTADFRKALDGGTNTQVATVSIKEAAATLSVQTRADETEPTAEPTATPPVAADDVMTLAEANAENMMTVVVNYQISSTQAAAEPYAAQIAKGSSLSSTLTLPRAVGYLATDYTVEPAEYKDQVVSAFVAQTADAAGSISLNVTEELAARNYTITVRYTPTNVPYTVNHYLQNANDDDYTLDATETITSKVTGDVVGADLANEYDGFTALWYDSNAEIAADGSTVVDIYYNRNYYQMRFDLGGGYGVDPIYGRYGMTIPNVGTPTLPGYPFMGWAATDGGAVNTALPPTTMPSQNVTYYAVWGDAQTVEYTIVYWRENANDNGYSYWKSDVAEATAGTYVDGSDSLAASDTVITINNTNVTEKNYFTYNDALTQKHVYVNGDGSTVVNVYYTRNVYTITFYYDGDCKLEVHTHTDNCYTFACDIEVHDHETAGCVTDCGVEEHIHGSEDCTCTVTEHTAHTIDCYGDAVGNAAGNSAVNDLEDDYPNPSQGMVGRRWQYGSYRYYIYIDGTWYSYNSTQVSAGSTAPTTCTGLHTHGDGNCTCTEEAHAHSDACYTCEKTEHTHTTAACYKLTCGKTEHTHSNANCQYSGSNTDQDGQNGYRIFTVITAKYDADIDWPTAEDVPVNSSNQGFAFWTGDGVSNQSSKILTMTYNICTDGGGKMLANYRTAKYYLNYMFESFDQSDSNPANGTTRIKHSNGKYYDKSEAYSQEAWYGANQNTWGYKDISGMTPVSSDSAINDGNDNFWLYYDRLRYTFSFVSKTDTLLSTGQTVMFEQPLYDYSYTDANGTTTLLRTYVPPTDYYPEGLEEGAYRFAGWYTTPECYDGTEYVFVEQTEDVTGSIMPGSDLTLYAKWELVVHTVTYYMDSTKTGTPLYTQEVTHGEFAPDVADPQNGGYTFDGWFYTDDNGNEIKFDNQYLTIRKDLKVYAKWSSNTPVEFTFHFVDANGEQIATSYTGLALPNQTVTFDAYVGEELDLLPDTVDPLTYIPDVSSHSIVVNIDATKNVYYFRYTTGTTIPYTVQYIEATVEDNVWTPVVDANGNYNHVADEETKVTTNAIVTENYKPVLGYMPQYTQIRWIMSTTGENIIQFLYVQNDTDALYNVSHYLVDHEGNETLYREELNISGEIGTTYGEKWFNEADGNAILGYEFASAEVDETVRDGDAWVTNTVDPDGVDETTHTVSHKLPAGGMHIKLYYTPILYPYIVYHVDEDGKELVDPDTGTAAYGSTIVASDFVKTITNYEVVSMVPTSWVIQIEELAEGEVPTINVITITYKLSVSTLTITKTVANSASGATAPTGDTFTIQVELPDGEYTYTVNGVESETKLTVTGGVGRLPITAGATIVIESIVIGSEYTVTEINVPTYFEESAAVNGTIDADGETAAIINTYQTGSLTISKTVEGASAPDDSFTFTLALSEKHETYAYTKTAADATTSTGTVAYNGTVTLKKGESVTITGIPAGTTYTVKETVDDDKYATKVNGTDGTTATGTISANAAAEAVFVNTYQYGKLTIKKTGAMKEGETAIFEVTDGTTTYTVALTVDASGNAETTIAGLKVDTSWTVKELTGWSWQYTSNPSFTTVTIDLDGETVTFTNTKNTDKWLHDESAEHNVFGTPVESTTAGQN